MQIVVIIIIKETEEEIFNDFLKDCELVLKHILYRCMFLTCSSHAIAKQHEYMNINTCFTMHP